MTPFGSAPHGLVLGLLLQLGALLLLARAFGEVARRLGQPAVVGELLAGIVLGPSLLGSLVPFVDVWLIPDPGPAGWMLEAVGMLGAMLLMLLTGMETDLGLLRRHTRAATGTSLFGIAIPFATGFLLGQYLPASLMGDDSHRLVFALFVATAMSISAIPVIAKVLMDMDLMRRDVGQTIIAAGMTDDTIGWLLLSVVAGLATRGAVEASDIALALMRVIGFLAVAFTAGAWLVRALLDYVRERVRGQYAALSVVFGVTLAFGAAAQALALEAVFGAFIAGILIGRVRSLPEGVHHQVAATAFALFTPIFFAIAGLKIDARALAQPTLLGTALLVIAVATFGKVVGGYIGGRWIGRRDHWTSLAFGIGMNARGAMEIIIATIGLNLGVISRDMFSIIVVMAMVTSLMASPGLRWALRRAPQDADEAARLREEAHTRDSRTARIQRVLMPLRRRPLSDGAHRLEAALLERLARSARIDVTLFNAAMPGERSRGHEYLDAMAPRFGRANVKRRVVEAAADVAIMEEVRKGYDLLMLGASRSDGTNDALFHPFVDRIVRLAPCPTLIVRGATAGDAWPPRRILVPTGGSQASREAAELAFRLADENDEVVLLHVVRTEGQDIVPFGTAQLEQRQLELGNEIVTGLQTLARDRGVRASPLVVNGADPESVILDVARSHGIGMIILGTSVRAGAGRLFLGPRVERILESAPCAALVYNARG